MPRRSSLWLTGFLLLATAAPADDGAPASATEDAAAHAIEFRPSKYAELPRYQEIVAQAVPLRRHAVEAIRRRLDITYDDKLTIRVRFQDLAADGTPAKAEHMALRITETVNGRETAVIVLYWEYLITGACRLKDELTHEFFHAVHREQINEAAYTAIPRWVREGLALYVAEQGPDRLDYLLQDKIDSGPDMLVQGLECGQHTLDDYGEDALAFEYLEVQHGREKFLAVVNDIVFARRTYRDAIYQHTGEAWAAFQEHARQHALRAFRSREGGLRDGYLAVFQRYLRNDCAGSLAGFRTLMQEHPDVYWIGLAHYYLARSLFELKRYEEAGVEFRRIVAQYSGRIGLVDDAQYYAGQCAFECGQWAEAERELRGLLRDYPFAAYFSKGRMVLGRTLGESGRTDEARAMLTLAAAENVGADVGAPALWHLSLLHEKAGDGARSRTALVDLIRRFPKSEEATPAKKKLDAPKSKE